MWRDLSNLFAELHGFGERITNLEKGFLKIMGIETDIKTEFEAYKANVDAKIASQNASIEALNAKISALPPSVDMTALQEDLAEIKAANDALNPPTPAPAS